MSISDVEEANRQVTVERRLDYHDLGAIWAPSPPKPVSGIASNLAPANITMCVSMGEIAMMRRVAAADADGTGICAPARPDRTLEWLSGMGLFEKLTYEGRTAYRLTECGRVLATKDEDTSSPVGTLN